MKRAAGFAIGLWHHLRLARLPKSPGWRRVHGGVEMELNGDDAMGRRFFLGTHEPELLLVLEAVVGPGQWCVDAGAHEGYITLQLARRAGSDGRVLAFEPDPAAREVLRRNCERNAFTQVEVLPFAIGDGDGPVPFSISRQSGWSSRFPNELSRPLAAGTISVEGRSLDSLLRGGQADLDPKRLSLVKLDCEGSEKLALLGMTSALAASDPVLWVELNRGALGAAGTSPEEVVRLLEDLRFQVFVPRRRWALGPGWRLELSPLAAVPVGPGVMNVVAVRRGERMAALTGAVAAPVVAQNLPRRGDSGAMGLARFDGNVPSPRPARFWTSSGVGRRRSNPLVTEEWAPTAPAAHGRTV